jgi:polyisoprenoid-binding protein YceI
MQLSRIIAVQNVVYKMKKFALLFIITLSAYTTFSQGKTTIAHSKISFQIKNMGIGTSGTISGLQAEIKFTPADLAASNIEASVETNTLNTDNDSRDEHLKNSDFFDVARYPKITLKSLSFKHKSGANFLGVFNLTIKGKTKQIEIPFSYNEKEGTAKMEGTFKINRLDFGVGDSSLVLSNDATVNIEVEADK